MKIDTSSLTPIYVQIADAIEDDILFNKLKEGGSCYSQVIISKELKVNPATAAKGINLLVTRGILEKKRGQAMTVALNAKEKILERKKEDDFSKILRDLVTRAKKLNLSEDYVHKAIKKIFQEE